MLERQRDKGLKVGCGQIVESFVDRLRLDFILYGKGRSESFRAEEWLNEIHSWINCL